MLHYDRYESSNDSPLFTDYVGSDLSNPDCQHGVDPPLLYSKSLMISQGLMLQYSQI